MIDIHMSPESRLDDWKDFRHSISEENEENQLNAVAEYFSRVPVNNFYLDDEYPEGWPTPWEVIYEGDYCPTAISYLMMKTLKLTNPERWEDHRFSLKLIKDLGNDIMQVVLVVDEKWLLNYSWSKVENWSDFSEQCQILNTIDV